MRAVEFTLRHYLNQHGLSAYRLAEAAKGRVSRGTVYALARGDTARIDLDTLGAVITTLEELTGQEVNPGDLLRAVTVPDLDAESSAWLNVDAARLSEFEPYDWNGIDPHTLGEPVRVTTEGDIVIGV